MSVSRVWGPPPPTCSQGTTPGSRGPRCSVHSHPDLGARWWTLTLKEPITFSLSHSLKNLDLQSSVGVARTVPLCDRHRAKPQRLGQTDFLFLVPVSGSLVIRLPSESGITLFCWICFCYLQPESLTNGWFSINLALFSGKVWGLSCHNNTGGTFQTPTGWGPWS